MRNEKAASELTSSRIVLIVMFLALDEHEPEAVLERAGLPERLLDDMEGAIPIENVARMIACITEIVGESAVGLRVGQEFGIEMLDVVGMVVSNSPSLRTAINHISEYMPLISHLTYFGLHEEATRARIFMHLPEELTRLNNSFLADFCAAVFSVQRVA